MVNDLSTRNLKFFIRTFGCQMNENDSERIAGLLHSSGFEKVTYEEKSDIVIINTCAVRQKSEEKLFSYLGRLNQVKKGLIIGITGCVAQLEREKIFKRAPYVDFILGTHAYYNLPEILKKIIIDKEKVNNIRWHKEWQETPDECILRENKVIGYVTIMEGCNNFCSYCIVPFTRGREKYRPFNNILKEIRKLADKGYKEIQLLGQNVNSYYDHQKEKNFVDLLTEINKIKGIEWIRFITSHPKNFSEEIAQAMKDLEKVCPQLHLPVQSGSSSVLQRMKRGYDRQTYLKKIDFLKKLIPNINLSTDIIVGSPGESREEFEETLSLLREVEYNNIFSFRYSPRPFTAASKLKDDVPFEEKKNRLIQVQSLQKEIQLKNNRKKIGQKLKVLTLGKSKRDSKIWSGRTEHYQVVNFHSNQAEIGKFVEVLITDVGPYSLRGKQENSYEL
ncbi:MAG: tRNA (N6-isopentenyl adenosine(37)-C2)-methylthiotransferase MiaB [Candidatus Aminicenantia bacterium]